MDSLKFLSYDSIARIGGRSKEGNLDNCNLKELSKSAPKSKTVQGELAQLYEEKDQLTSELAESLQELQESSVLTYHDVILALDEDQLTSLYIKTKYSKKRKEGKITCKINKYAFVDEKFVRDNIKKIQVKYKTLKDFLLCHDDKDNVMSNLFEVILETWTPSLRMMRKLKEVQDQYITDIKKAQELAQDGDTSTDQAN